MSNTEKKTVVFIEDDEIFMDIMINEFKHYCCNYDGNQDFELKTFTNAKAAAEYLISEAPRVYLLICDTQLEEEECGLKLASQVREKFRDAEVCFISRKLPSFKNFPNLTGDKVHFLRKPAQIPKLEDFFRKMFFYHQNNCSLE